MRVLWVSQVPPAALARSHAGQESLWTGSWIPALERLMRDHPAIDLHIAALTPADDVVVDAGVTYHGVGIKQRSRVQRLRDNWGVGQRALEETSRMLKLVDDVRPDVIHVHGTEHGFSNLVLGSRIPCLLSMQGLLTVYERMSTRELNVWPEAWLGDVSGLLKAHTPLHQRHEMRIRSLRERHILAAAAYLGGRTEWDRMVASILAPQATYFHCGEALRPQFYEAAWGGVHEGAPIVYSTIGPASYKGVETLIEATALAARRGHVIRLRLAGISEDFLSGRAARRIARRLGISSRVSLLGRLTASEIVEELEQCSAYVCPSHIENSPNGLCEALMMGVPCVATAVGGVPSLVSRQECWLLQDGDPWHMAAAMSEILEQPETAVERGIRAKLRAHERHDRASVRAGLIGVYEAIARQARQHQ